MLSYVLAFVLPLAAMLLIIPVLRKLAFKIDYTEKPDMTQDRKIHKEDKPYLAGVGIFVTFWVFYLILVRDFSTTTLLLFISSFIIFAVGMVDDWFKIKGKDLSALPKFIVQIAACALVYIAGIRFSGIMNPFNQVYIFFPAWLQFTLTITWLFGVTTVINFMDGMDGLAGGLVCISACTMSIVAFAKGDPSSAMMGIILVGICLGYLRYNKFPSKILMGDAGATFLGFMLGFISLDGVFKQATAISILVPVLALGLPIFDNIYVMFKRIREHKPIYIGDSSQVHYRLLKHGLNQKQVVYFLYLSNLCLNLVAIIIFIL
jgi:UDP-N-acetylmuramyl pentapeptide phosphotransferase/UDP-N-acetylglucosamine-1-phosphate transferase